MSPAISMLILGAAIVATAAIRRQSASHLSWSADLFGDHTGPYEEDASALRRTIAVNLSILDPELKELRRIARQSSPTADVERATELLRLAREGAESAEIELRFASSTDLGATLGSVFAAMNCSSKARRLLGACHPPKLL